MHTAKSENRKLDLKDSGVNLREKKSRIKEGRELAESRNQPKTKISNQPDFTVPSTEKLDNDKKVRKRCTFIKRVNLNDSDVSAVAGCSSSSLIKEEEDLVGQVLVDVKDCISSQNPTSR